MQSRSKPVTFTAPISGGLNAPLDYSLGLPKGVVMEEVLPTAKQTILKLEGSWIIERARELKSVLIQSLKEYDRIIVDLEGLTQADLSFLQLFCSAHRTSLKLGKHFALDQNKPALVKKLVREAGYERTLGCHRDPCKSCLWKEGWER
jgi:anti-anti-sigma regulatory factor